MAVVAWAIIALVCCLVTLFACCVIFCWGSTGTHGGKIVCCNFCWLLLLSIFSWGQVYTSMVHYNNKLPAVCLDGRRIGQNLSDVNVIVDDTFRTARSQLVTKQCFIPIAVYPCYDGSNIAPDVWRGDCRKLSTSPLPHWPDFLIETSVTCNYRASISSDSCEARSWSCPGGACAADEFAAQQCKDKIVVAPYACYYVPDEIAGIGELRQDEASSSQDGIIQWWARTLQREYSENGVYKVHEGFPTFWFSGGVFFTLLLVASSVACATVLWSQDPIGSKFFNFSCALILAQLVWLIILITMANPFQPPPEPLLPIEAKYSWRQEAAGNVTTSPTLPSPVGHDKVDVLLLIASNMFASLVCVALIVKLVMHMQRRGASVRSQTSPGFKTRTYDVAALSVLLEVESTYMFVQQVGHKVSAVCRRTQTPTSEISIPAGDRLDDAEDVETAGAVCAAARHVEETTPDEPATAQASTDLPGVMNKSKSEKSPTSPGRARSSPWSAKAAGSSPRSALLQRRELEAEARKEAAAKAETDVLNDKVPSTRTLPAISAPAAAVSLTMAEQPPPPPARISTTAEVLPPPRLSRGGQDQEHFSETSRDAVDRNGVTGTAGCGGVEAESESSQVAVSKDTVPLDDTEGTPSGSRAESSLQVETSEQPLATPSTSADNPSISPSSGGKQRARSNRQTPDGTRISKGRSNKRVSEIDGMPDSAHRLA